MMGNRHTRRRGIRKPSPSTWVDPSLSLIRRSLTRPSHPLTQASHSLTQVGIPGLAELKLNPLSCTQRWSGTLHSGTQMSGRTPLVRIWMRGNRLVRGKRRRRDARMEGGFGSRSLGCPMRQVCPGPQLGSRSTGNPPGTCFPIDRRPTPGVWDGSRLIPYVPTAILNCSAHLQP